MFIESAFITREFKEEQIPILERVTCLSVVNIGTTVAVINGISVHPNQKQILIPPDGTFSRVKLEVSYLPNKSLVGIDPILIRKMESTQKAGRKILLIYKKLI